jgi:hypothetical protein
MQRFLERLLNQLLPGWRRVSQHGICRRRAARVRSRRRRSQRRHR